MWEKHPQENTAPQNGAEARRRPQHDHSTGFRIHIFLPPPKEKESRHFFRRARPLEDQATQPLPTAGGEGRGRPGTGTQGKAETGSRANTLTKQKRRSKPGPFGYKLTPPTTSKGVCPRKPSVLLRLQVLSGLTQRQTRGQNVTISTGAEKQQVNPHPRPKTHSEGQGRGARGPLAGLGEAPAQTQSDRLAGRCSPRWEPRPRSPPDRLPREQRAREANEGPEVQAFPREGKYKAPLSGIEEDFRGDAQRSAVMAREGRGIRDTQIASKPVCTLRGIPKSRGAPSRNLTRCLQHVHEGTTGDQEPHSRLKSLPWSHRWRREQSRPPTGGNWPGAGRAPGPLGKGDITQRRAKTQLSALRNQATHIPC